MQTDGSGLRLGVENGEFGIFFFIRGDYDVGRRVSKYINEAILFF